MEDTIVDTQRDSYDAASHSAATLRENVVAVLLQHARGLTADQVAAHVGATPFAIRPRVTELLQAGRIVDTGERRMNSSGRRARVVVAA